MASESEETNLRLQAETDEILQARGLHSLLAEFGAVRPIGGYVLGLTTTEARERDLGIMLAEHAILGPIIYTLRKPCGSCGPRLR